MLALHEEHRRIVQYEPVLSDAARSRPLDEPGIERYVRFFEFIWPDWFDTLKNSGVIDDLRCCPMCADWFFATRGHQRFCRPKGSCRQAYHVAIERRAPKTHQLRPHKH